MEALLWRAEQEASLSRLIEAAFGRPPFEVLRITPLPSVREAWAGAMSRFLAGDGGRCLLTVGGSGFPPEELVPDVTAGFISRPIPGIPEILRELGSPLEATAPLFRGTAGLAPGGKLIVNLPGSSRWLEAGLDFLRRILPHALDKAFGDTRECGVF